MNRWSGVGALLMYLAMFGCAGASSSSAPVPDDQHGRQAAEILNSCRSRDYARQLSCHETRLLDLLQDGGVARAMAVAERMGDLDHEVERQGHVYAHAIGLAAYTDPESVGSAFASCTPAFQSGCYHGVIQSFFVDVGNGGATPVGADAINALCADHRGSSGDRWLLFQCAHGIGHGVTMINDHHLPRALAACDLITDDWERQACYGGAFMENVIQATAPHHSVGRPKGAGDGAHAHHGTGGHHEQPMRPEEPAEPTAPAEPGEPGEHGEHAKHAIGGGGAPITSGAEGDLLEAPFPPLDPDDPLYPCNVLPERYLPSCYHMQTSAILFFNGGDIEGAAQACHAAPEGFRAACFQSLGRDVSAVTVQDHQQALDLCEIAGDRRFDCHWGYVKNVVDVTARVEDGFEFCALVPQHVGRQECYEAVGEQVWVLEEEVAGREARCGEIDPTYREACRYGAGLPPRAADASPSGG